MALEKEKIFFAEHLSLMIKGGTSIADGLETLRSEATSRSFKKALKDVLERVLEGQKLHKSLEKHPRIFNHFFTNVVKVGEESGSLEENLKYLSDSLRNEYALRKKVAGALIYPILVMIVAIVVLLVLTTVVLPRVVEYFKTFEFELPVATKILLSASVFLKDYLVLIIIVLFILFIISIILNRIRIFRFYFHKFSLSLPLFGRVNRDKTLSRFTRTFYTLLKSGVPLLEALDITADTLTNEVYKSNLRAVQLEVERGGKISSGLKRFPASFPPIFVRMILVGGKTGTLEESLIYLSDFYEKEMDNTLKNLSNTLEPALLIFVGLLIAFIALAVMTPFYQFITQLQGQIF